MQGLERETCVFVAFYGVVQWEVVRVLTWTLLLNSRIRAERYAEWISLDTAE